MPNASDGPVHLLRDASGQLAVPVHAEAVALVLDLEARGVVLAVDGTDLVARPRRLLTDADRAALRRLKPHVRHFLAYVPPGLH